MAIKASLYSWLNNPLTGTGPQNSIEGLLSLQAGPRAARRDEDRFGGSVVPQAMAAIG